MTKKITLFLFFIGGMNWCLLRAQQDPMFTKYMFNSQVFNPAYAASKDFLSVNILYREQWWGLTQGSGGNAFKYSPSTQTVTLQSPVGNRVSLGGTLINDRIGARSSTTANFVYAYHFPFATGELSIGLQGGLINWRADWSRLNFKDPQTDDPIYAENNPNRIVPNVGVGLYYYSDNFYAGFSIPHVIENDLRDFIPEIDQNSSRNVDRYYRHYFFMTGAAIELAGKSLVFKPSLLIKNVGLLSDFAANQQSIAQVGAPTEFDIDLSLFFNEVFWIGVAYRSAFEVAAFGGESSNDSVDIWFSFYLDNGMRIGAAYDFPLSQIRRSTAGSFELMVGYDLDYKVRKVHTPRYF
ncbi:MAG: type IX secretion system membrane protein PorP/SprF [Bacteroidota bacterium]